MRALVIARPGGPEVLELRDVPRPRPGPGELLVCVRAAGINRADLSQIAGRYPAPDGWPQDIPGLEFAGTIEEVGADVRSRVPGKRVMGLVGGGGLAEYVRCPAEHAMTIPDALSFEEGAAIPEAFITAHDALFSQAGLTQDETVLVHAVGSGVGTAALQLAHAVDARVIGTSRSEEKLRRAAELAPLVAIDTEREDFAEAALRATDGRGVDVVLELVGGDYLAGDVRALAHRGRIVVVGLVRGREAPLDMGTILRRRARIIGTALRSRSDEEKAIATQAFAGHALPLIAMGRVRPVVSNVVPPEEAVDAFEAMRKDETFGKVVVRF